MIRQVKAMQSDEVEITRCWCGSDKFEEFSENYVKCNNCKTLINTPRPCNDYYNVINDSQDFYGKKYWFEHQKENSNLPSIVERARTDIYDRCVKWLKIVLKYKLPPGKVLEIGCGNGSFLAILESCGFDEIGIELSPWVVEFVKEYF